MTNITAEEELNNGTEFGQLLKTHLPHVPIIGEEVSGTVVFVSKNEVLVDLDGFSVGVIRGRELKDISGEYDALQVGQKITAKVLDTENERGQVELSLREFGEEKAWSDILELYEKQDVIDVKIDEVNKGGLLLKVKGVVGFLPVSQLSSEHYPRVEGGDKNRILKALKRFVGKTFKVKVITVDQDDLKVIVSEKAAWEDHQKEKLAQCSKGDIVEGEVKAIANFGVFIGFQDDLEGLIHISELSWRKVDDPHDVVSLGDKLKAQILEIDGTKVFLSLKRLSADPWASVASTYRVGQVITGTVSKINPFGAFIDIGNGLQGLAHISELADHKVEDPHKIVKVGEDREFRIIELAPEDHRIGLSIKALGEWSEQKKEEQKEESVKEDVAPVEAPRVPSEDVPVVQSLDSATLDSPPLSE